MKRIWQSLAVAVVSIGLFGVVTPTTVSAETCSGAVITNTGPGSHNEITCVNAQKIRVTCINNIYVVNENDQDAESGDATVSGNTTGGSSITGNATNENGTVVRIGSACGAAAPVSSPTPSPSPSPSPSPTPTVVVPTGNGSVMGAATTKPSVLPDTASNSVVDAATITTAIVAGALVVSRVALAAYSRFALK